MKKLLVVLALSLAANAAFLVTSFLRPRPTATSAATTALATATPRSGEVADTSGTGLSPADVAAFKRSGELIKEGSLRALVARLRAAGFPPYMIRGIVTAKVTEEFGARKKAVVAHQEVVPYWRSAQSFPHDPKAGAELAALTREQTVLLKDLLGPDAAPSDEWSRLIQERKYGSLSQDKIDKVQLILNDYNDLRSQIMAEGRGVFLQEDNAKYQLLLKEQRADIATLFTPEELEDYDLRNSPLSFRLRSQLSAFQPSEEEYKLIFRLTQAAEAKSGPTRIGVGPISPVRNPADAAKGPDLQTQIADALGAERGLEYRVTTNPEYQQLSQLVTRLDLPPTATPQVMAIQQEVQSRITAVLEDRTASGVERNRQLAALSQETYSRISSVMGTHGYDAYRKFGGQWLNRMPEPVTGTSEPKS